MNMCIFFKTIPRALNWLALSSVIVLLTKVFYLNNIPEPMKGMYQLGLVVEGVLASTLASYVFYLIIVHFKETRDRSIIYPNILRWAEGVVGNCESQLSIFSQKTEHQATLQSLKQNDINIMFDKINPHSNAPLFIGTNQANWMQYFEYYRERTKRSIMKIMAQLIFLEAPLVACLTKIDDCSHFSDIEMFLYQPISNQDLSAFSSAFYDYCVACRELNMYLKQHPYK